MAQGWLTIVIKLLNMNLVLLISQCNLQTMQECAVFTMLYIESLQEHIICQNGFKMLGNQFQDGTCQS